MAIGSTSPMRYPKIRFCKKIYRGADEFYLRRIYLIPLKLVSFGVYLHQILISDYPRLHNHPFNFWAMPILRGYWEHDIFGRRIWRRPFRMYHRKKEEFHWIETTGKPAWTIFIRGNKPNGDNWGFITDDGTSWIHWKDYYSNVYLIRPNI